MQSKKSQSSASQRRKMQGCNRSNNMFLFNWPLALVISVTLHCPFPVQAAPSECAGDEQPQQEVDFEPDSPGPLVNERVALIQTAAALSENRVVESSAVPLNSPAKPRNGSALVDARKRKPWEQQVPRRFHMKRARRQRVCRGRPLGVFDVTTTTVLLSVFSAGIGAGVTGTLLVLFMTRGSCSPDGSKSAECSTPVAAKQALPALATTGSASAEEAPGPHHGTVSTGAAAVAAQGPPSDAVSRIPSSEVHSATEGLESMHLFWPRAGCLVGLLLIQSLSSLIMTGFDQLFEANPVLVFFLTMIVGTGGNVGGQTVVMAVRKLALGEDVGIAYEALVGLKLCAVLVPVAFIRCWAQQVSVAGSMTVAISVLAVVVIGAFLGAGLPKVLFMLSIDPAHATPMIQVVMDILGVCIICFTGLFLLGRHGTGEHWTVL